MAAAAKVLDANIRYRDSGGKWDVTAFANNVLDSQVITRAQATGAGNSVIFFAGISTPRLYGLRANYYY